MKIIVQGNCQSRPVTAFLDGACVNAELMQPVVTQLQAESNCEKNYEAFNEADYIFAQWVSDDYHVPHLSTSRLQSEFGNKVITWPNAFFIGQNPDMVAIATQSKPRLLGPLDTYHSRSIFKSWLNGVSKTDCVKLLCDQDARTGDLLEKIDISLEELKKREGLLDISISDYIEENWLDEKLFHVFNHPTNRLLIELVNRMCNCIDSLETNSILPELWPEYLNRIIAPGVPAITKALRFTFDTSTTSKGFSLSMGKNNQLELGSVSVLSIERLVDGFYLAYDNQLSKTDEYSFTPGYLQENYHLDLAA